MTTSERLYTADELWALSHSDTSKKWELSKGVLVEVSPTGNSHTILAVELARVIGNFVKAHKLGKVTGEAGGYILSENPDIVRAPDVGFIAKARAKSTDKYFPGAPDLAVEIVSPGDTETEIAKKVREYLDAGTRLIWFFYPASRTVKVHTPTMTKTLDENDVLDGMDVLPGFLLSVRDIFAVLDE